MSNENRTTTFINISHDTRNLLNTMKLDPSESYNDIISKLLYLEENYNTYNQEVHEYELFIDGLDTSKLFKIRWRFNSYKILFYDEVNNSFQESATVWCKLGDDEDEVHLFVDALLSFMAREDARPLLLGMNDSLSFSNYTIKLLR